MLRKKNDFTVKTTLTLMLAILALSTGCSQDPAMFEDKGREYYGKNTAHNANVAGNLVPQPLAPERAMVPEIVVEERPIDLQSPAPNNSREQVKDLYQQVERNQQQPKPITTTEPTKDAYNEPLSKPISPIKEVAKEALPDKNIIIEAESLEAITSFKTETPLDNAEFEWPVKGEILSHYGEASGKFKEGISIATSQGTPVKAASNGEVIYVGNDSEGFGQLIIVKHDNDIMTAYAHNNSILVQKGQKVVKGQAIAKVGKTGEAKTSQLYFSIRKGKTTLNPEASIH